MRFFKENIRFLLLTVLFIVGCTRPEGELSSKVTLNFPKGLGSGKLFSESLSNPIPVGKKACFAVHVTGPGIPSERANACSPQVSIVGGFVEGGASISLDVPRGTDRSFDVYIYLAGTSEACPEFNLSFTEDLAKLNKIYMAGSKAGVPIQEDNEKVELSYDFPGESSPLPVTHASNWSQTTCAPPESLKAMLGSNGDVEDVATNTVIPSYSNPTNESFYMTTLTLDTLGVGMVTTGGVLNFDRATPDHIPPEVFSVTRKPDTGAFYGLLHSGKIVSLTLNGASTTYTELSTGDCPFAVSNCEVPVWMQSISAGRGTKLFGLDHSGRIHQLTSSGPTETAASVPPYVTQVSYY